MSALNVYFNIDIDQVSNGNRQVQVGVGEA